MIADKVRVRIAPSPTGYLHVGTARAALFNYLLARHFGGSFLVRIEDTDLERSKPEFIEPILNALDWLGMNSDEEIRYQSKRSDLYAEYLKRFIDTEYAYHCFCSQEELQKEREAARAEKRSMTYSRKCLRLSKDEVKARLDRGDKAVIRVKIPDGETVYDDMVSGHLSRKREDIEDFIVARSDGSVTYNFAVVVDDFDMGITHVIRGNDHITNTFKQVILYNALGLKLPVFGHVPMILRPDKKKVSKRLGDKDVGEYSKEGILKEAMINYLALLGWSPKTDREIYTEKELIEIFNPDHFNASNSIFDIDKLLAFNKSHIVLKTSHELAEMVAPMLVDAGLTTKYWLETRWEYLRQVIDLLKERVTRLTDFPVMGKYFFDFDFTYDEKAAEKHFHSESASILIELKESLDKLENFTLESTEAALSTLSEKLEIKKAKIIHPTRLAISGLPGGPGLYDLIVTLGKSVVIERLQKAIEFMQNMKNPEAKI